MSAQGRCQEGCCQRVDNVFLRYLVGKVDTKEQICGSAEVERLEIR